MCDTHVYKFLQVKSYHKVVPFVTVMHLFILKALAISRPMSAISSPTTRLPICIIVLTSSSRSPRLPLLTTLILVHGVFK